MTDTTAAYYRARSHDRHSAARGGQRRIVRGAVIGLAAVAAAGALVTSVTLTAAWFAGTSLSSNPRMLAPGSTGPRALTLAGSYNVAIAENSAAAPDTNFETRWANARLPASASVAAVPLLAQPRIAVAANVPLPPSRPNIPVQAAEAPKTTTEVPLPRPHPARQEIVQAQAEIKAEPKPEPKAELKPEQRPEPKAAPQIAAAAPPSTPRKPAPQASDRLASLPGPESRTAIYDIAGHTVHLPNGETLEAHSGLGDKLDDPRFVNVRMRGPTPPNVYDLTLREEPFHGVRAIRLNPVDDHRMYGRDGMLAHTYMLGPNGQSNGCVSFKDYDKFLRAFLDGEVDRLVVVAKLGNTPLRVARSGYQAPDRFALNNQ